MHHPHETIKPTTITNTMKTCPFCTTPPITTDLHPLLHGNSVHLHNHSTNQHIILTKQRSNTDIAHAIQVLTTLLRHAPYTASAQHTTFKTILLTALHHFDNSPFTPNMDNQYTADLPFPLPTRQQRTHRSIQSSTRHWAQSLAHVSPRHDACLAHTHGLVSALPPNNYTQDSLTIIDHLCIGILPAALHRSIKIFLTSVARHQLTTHNQYHRSASTPPTILALYYDKATHNTTLKQAFNAMDINENSTLAHIYYKAWNIITISLLQRARNVQHIIHALIYHHHTK